MKMMKVAAFVGVGQIRLDEKPIPDRAGRRRGHPRDADDDLRDRPAHPARRISDRARPHRGPRAGRRASPRSAPACTASAWASACSSAPSRRAGSARPVFRERRRSAAMAATMPLTGGWRFGNTIDGAPGRIPARPERAGQPGAHSRFGDGCAGADVGRYRVDGLRAAQSRAACGSATRWSCSRRDRSVCARPPERAHGRVARSSASIPTAIGAGYRRGWAPT